MPSVIKNLSAGADELIFSTSTEVQIVSISITNTDPATSEFQIYKKQDTTVCNLVPVITLDATSPTGRGTFVYQNFTLDSGFELWVRVPTGSVDIDLNWQPIR